MDVTSNIKDVTSNIKDGSVEGTWRVSPAENADSAEEEFHIARHLAAYDFALENMAAKDIVVDVACGFGVGVSRVASDVERLIIMDLARNALQSVNVADSLSKVQADATKIPVASNSVDALLAFQLIEHVDQPGALNMLKEFERVLRPGGIAFVTTPNARWRLLPFQKPWNPYHVKEYRPSEIKSLCIDADLSNFEILGLLGKHGAQESEIARVRQDPLATYLKLPSVFRWYVRKLFGAVRKPRSIPTGSSNELFEFNDDFRAGLDFMIVIRKPDTLN